MPDSPLLTPEALEAAEPWRTKWRTEEDGVRRPASYTLKPEQIARAFLAAHDPEALVESYNEGGSPDLSELSDRDRRLLSDYTRWLGLGGDDA